MRPAPGDDNTLRQVVINPITVRMQKTPEILQKLRRCMAAVLIVIKQQYPHARFILLGGLDDNPGALSRQDVQAWADEGILEWPGHVPVQPWLAQASVFVLPSYYREGVPASTQEAMAMGRAVITTDAPGCRETVVDHVNGFLVPVRNPHVLAEKMRRFIEQPDLIVSMGEASRRMAEERFDVHKVNQRLIGVLLGNTQAGRH